MLSATKGGLTISTASSAHPFGVLPVLHDSHVFATQFVPVDAVRTVSPVQATLPSVVLARMLEHARSTRSSVGARPDVDVLAGQRVSSFAVGLICLSTSERITSQDVHSMGNGLHMGRIKTCPVPASVIQFLSAGDWTDNQLIDDKVRGSVATGRIDATIPDDLGPWPLPAQSLALPRSELVNDFGQASKE